MPRYRVTNSEGRTLILIGEKPPTKEQLDHIFATVPKDYSYKGKPKEQEQATTESPNAAVGTTRELIRGITLGAAPLIAGATNVYANEAAAVTQALQGNFGALKQADPRKIPEQFRQGRAAFNREQAAFQEEHPTLSSGANVAGNIAGYIAPAGAVARGIKGATVAAKVARGLLPAAVPMAAQKGLTEASKDDTTVGKVAAQTGLGAVEGAAFGAVFGALNPFKGAIMARAAQMTGKPLLAKAIGEGVALPAEAGAIGAVPALTRGRLPTKEELKNSLIFTTIARGLGSGAAYALPKVRKAFTEPTQAEVREAAERVAKNEAAAQKGGMGGKFNGKHISPAYKSDSNGEKGSTYPTEKELEIFTRARKALKGNERFNELWTKGNLSDGEKKEMRDLFQEYENIAKQYENREKELNSLRNRLPKLNEQQQEQLREILRNSETERILEEKLAKVSQFNKEKNLMLPDAKWEEYLAAEKNLSNYHKKEWLLLTAGKKKIGTADGVKGSITKKEGAKDTAKLEELNKKKTDLERKAEELRGPYLEKDITATPEEIAAYKKKHTVPSDAYAKRIIEETKYRQAQAEAAAPEPKKETFKSGVKGFVRSVQRFLDVLEPIEYEQKLADKVRGTQTGIADSAANTLEELKTGGVAQVRASETYQKLKALEKADKDLPMNADKYMQAAKRVEMAENAQAAGKPLADISPEVLAQDREIISTASPQIKEYANAVYEYNQKALDNLYKSGRISDEMYQSLKANKSYVPSRAELDSLVEGEPIIKADVEASLKRYKGKGDLYEDATLSSIEQGTRIDNFAALQKAKREYIRDAQITGNATKADVKVEAGKYPQYNSKNQIVVWEKGTPQVWNVPESVAKIFNPKAIKEENVITKATRRAMQAFKGFTTGITIGFAGKNVARDVLGSKASKYGEQITPADIAESAEFLLGNKAYQSEAVKEVQRAIGFKGTRVASQIKDRDAADILDKAQLLNKGLADAAPAQSAKGKLFSALAYALQKGGKAISDTASKGWKGYLEAASFLGERSEMVTRLTVWKSVLKGNAKNAAQLKEWIENPNSIPREVRAEARREAREVSLNFTREMNPIVEAANRYLIPYFKPAILGGKRMWEVFTNPEIAPKAWNLVANMGALQAAYKTGKLTDKEKDQLDQFNNEMSANNFQYTDSNGKLRTIPLNQELAPAIKLFALAIEKAEKKGEAKDVYREAKEALRQGTLNALFSSSLQGGDTTPQIVKPIAEVMLNKDFYTKTDIETPYMKKMDRAERYTQGTPKVFRNLAKVVPLSPVQLHHLWKGYTSSAGKEAVFYGEKAYSALKDFVGKDVDTSIQVSSKNDPIMRAFMPNLDTPYNQWAIDANDILDRAKQQYNFVKRKPGDFNELSDSKKQQYKKGYAIYQSTKSLRQSLDEIKKNRYAIFERSEREGKRIEKALQAGTITKKSALLRKKVFLKNMQQKLEKINDREKAIFKKIKQVDERYNNKNPR